MMGIIINPFKKILDFDGKASRSDFWIFFVFNVFMCFVFGILKNIFKFPGIFTVLFIFYLNFVTLSLGFRRLNDARINKLFFLIPFVNLVLATFPSKK